MSTITANTITANTRSRDTLRTRLNPIVPDKTAVDLTILDITKEIERFFIKVDNPSDATKLNERLIEIVTRNYPTTLLTDPPPNSSEKGLFLIAPRSARLAILNEMTYTEQGREDLISEITEGQKKGRIPRETKLFTNLGSLIPDHILAEILQNRFKSLSQTQKDKIETMVLPELTPEQTTQLLQQLAIRPATHAKILLSAMVSGITISQLASSNIPTKFRLALGTCVLLSSIAPFAIGLQTTEKSLDAIQKKTKETIQVIARHILNHRKAYARVAIGASLAIGISYFVSRYKTSLLNQTTFDPNTSPSIPVSNEPPSSAESTYFLDVSTPPTTGDPSIGIPEGSERFFEENLSSTPNNIPQTEDSPFYRLYTKLRQTVLEDRNLRTKLAEDIALVREKALQIGAIYRDFLFELFIQTKTETLFEDLSPL